MSLPVSSKPPRIALWIGSLAMVGSLGFFPFLIMIANDLKRVLGPNRPDSLLSGKVLMFIGGVLENYWMIPAVVILLFYWFWCSRSSPRLITFAAIYSLFLVLLVVFPLHTYAGHSHLIQNSPTKPYVMHR